LHDGIDRYLGIDRYPARLFVLAGTIHPAKSVGTGHNAEFATYIVEMKKPLVVIVELKETWMGGVSQLSWSPGVSNNDA
jgi:hypothetical protein